MKISASVIRIDYWFIMDNATFHRKTVLQKMAEAKGCHVLMLPKYSPDFNKIEPQWANLKTFLRNHGRQYDSVQIAIYHYLHQLDYNNKFNRRKMKRCSLYHKSDVDKIIDLLIFL